MILANEEYFYNNQKYAMFLILSAVLALWYFASHMFMHLAPVIGGNQTIYIYP